MPGAWALGGIQLFPQDGQSVIAGLEQGTGGAQRNTFVWFSYVIVVKWVSCAPFQPILRSIME